MQTPAGQLTYCTNIHPGESWQEHFAQLQQFIPGVKQKVAAKHAFGIGLRLANQASLELSRDGHLHAFQQWLQEQDCYVFTMNGFPYGGFHHTRVKDLVHQPDWTTKERVEYTLRLAQLLAQLLPDGMDGGISTSPLSYGRWFDTPEKKQQAITLATQNVLQVVAELIRLKETTGKYLHLDIEPEPDGLIGNGTAFIDWYQHTVLPTGVPYLQQIFGYNASKAATALKDHLTLCYDVCHFAIGFEDHEAVIQQLQELGIKTGKIQISAALKASMDNNRKEIAQAFDRFNESTYLHQVVAKQTNGELLRYPDLPEALQDANNSSVTEWRAHFHVPLFIPDYGLLQSTQTDIVQVLSMQLQHPFTNHLEIETYTWEVLPDAVKLPMADSIIREMEWVKEAMAGIPNYA